MKLSIPDIFGIKAIRALRQSQANDFEKNIRVMSGWIEHSKEFAELSNESKVHIIQTANNYEWLYKRWKEKHIKE